MGYILHVSTVTKKIPNLNLDSADKIIRNSVLESLIFNMLGKSAMHII